MKSPETKMRAGSRCSGFGLRPAVLKPPLPLPRVCERRGKIVIIEYRLEGLGRGHHDETPLDDVRETLGDRPPTRDLEGLDLRVRRLACQGESHQGGDQADHGHTREQEAKNEESPGPLLFTDWLSPRGPSDE